MQVPQTEVVITVGGVERGRYVVERGEYLIGRNPECGLRVEADLVSRTHARLIVSDSEMLIEDLGSSNGTYINGRPVTGRTRLGSGQKIQIGAATIEVRALQSADGSDVTIVTAEPGTGGPAAGTVPRNGKYDVGAVIAQGGMGAILDAREPSIGRSVAMKVMLSNAAPEDAARFAQEARITGQLEHPNIVPVHELGVDESGQPFYTMKMVRGITLGKVLSLLKRGVEATVKKYPLAALLTIFQKVCDALAFAHSRGVIHRDLKPENIMLGDYGEVLVMDWGLAKKVGSAECGMRSEGGAAPALHTPHSELRTLSGTIMGTPQFMAPEQAHGEIERMDARSDIYSLGAILYQILALRVAVTGTDAMEVVGKVGRGEIEPLVAHAPSRAVPGAPAGERAQAAGGRPAPGSAPEEPAAAGRGRPAQHAGARALPHLPGDRIPESLAAVVRKAMAFDREARYRSVPDLQRDIEAFQGGFATSAENAGAWKQFTLLVKRHKATSIGVAAVLVLSIGFTAKVIAEGRRAERGEASAKTEAQRANAALADLKASAPSLLALAESEAGFQRFDSALVKLDAALALDPALTAGWWRRVWLLLGMARYGEAAAAFRTAQQRDPAQHAHDALLPVLDAIAAAPDDATRFPPERTEALFRHFTQVGASGELNALSQRLILGAKQKQQMVRQRLDEWLGKGVSGVNVQPDGSIEVVRLPKATDTLEPLRGLPIGCISIGGTAVRSLEPLRGMALTQLKIGQTRISDLAPLRGMPLTDFIADVTDISDLTPLAGMPLRSVTVSSKNLINIGPLRGAPLEEFHSTANRIVDFSPLRGAPLREVSISMNQCADLAFLADSPALESFNCAKNRIADLTPLRGKPLKFLNAHGNYITDLRPLAGLPLTELIVSANPVADYAPLRELRELQKLRISEIKHIKVSLEPLRQHPSVEYIALGDDGPYRPVAEFWADYDAQQAAGKK